MVCVIIDAKNTGTSYRKTKVFENIMPNEM